MRSRFGKSLFQGLVGGLGGVLTVHGQGFVDHVPGKDMSPKMLDGAGCARAKDRQVAGDYGDLSPAIQDCVLSTPGCGRELSWSEVQRGRRSDRQRQNRKYSRRAGGLPLHSIFGFQHVEFARQSGGVGGFCEVIGIDRSADQNCATIGEFAQ